MKRFQKAVLIIHGFSGNCYDQEYLRNYLQLTKRFQVFSFTLPAHEQMIINHVKYQDWIDAVDNQIKFLIDHGYHKIYVIGHSMGGVLASYLASKYKEIKKLVLVAPAFDSFSKDQYKMDIKNIKETLSDEDTTYKHLFSKFIRVPSKTFIEFHKLVEKLKPCLKQVTCDTLVLHGNKDEIVPYQTLDYVKDNLQTKKSYFTTIIDGRHHMLRGKKKEKLAEYINIYLIGGRKWKQIKNTSL